MNTAARWLLCRPQGGLNDILCQIEKCCIYAEQTGRTVLVDTHYTHSRFFRNEFSRYFESRQPRLVLSVDAIRSQLSGLAPYPECLKGRLESYQTVFNPEKLLMCDTQTGQAITFDFSRDHPHALLVHHQPGGGMQSSRALLRMRLKPDLTQELKQRILSIGANWWGVHIRHTDYQTDYRPLIERLQRAAPARLFLATDNQTVKEQLIQALPQTSVHSFAHQLSSGQEPLHKMQHTDEALSDRMNRDAILDLLTLALSEQLVFEKIQPNRYGTSYSGFAVLAHRLWSSNILLQQLLDDPQIDSWARSRRAGRLDTPALDNGGRPPLKGLSPW